MLLLGCAGRPIVKTARRSAASGILSDRPDLDYATGAHRRRALANLDPATDRQRTRTSTTAGQLRRPHASLAAGDAGQRDPDLDRGSAPPATGREHLAADGP